MTVAYGPPDAREGLGAPGVEEEFEEAVIEGSVVPRAIAIGGGIVSGVVMFGSIAYAIVKRPKRR